VSQDPSRWEDALKQKVDLFPETDFGELPADLQGARNHTHAAEAESSREPSRAHMLENFRSWLADMSEAGADAKREVEDRAAHEAKVLSIANARRHAERVRRTSGGLAGDDGRWALL
jgi:hypothetical protein